MTHLAALTAIRASIGVTTWFTPEVVALLLGFRRPVRPELRYVARIWGARNMAFAAATATVEDDARRSWLAANVAIDVIDLAAGALLLRAHRAGPVGAASALGLPAVAAGLGLAAITRRAEPRTR